ncbi:substrate-binding domain-containing protein [Pseudonocardia kujensis]|uniref:sugar ABC transporter substrate-binding protein n=1 Tax=Pseudonocardia kujensis TaxID=1128675 RepID=UPI001E3BCEC7|nr:substrate-binding domain-containing protein [Pseudonocardia kujensis]MCE0767612.1 substrate-binding domain-containing protein [Pseudonocardia kujensis]
MQRKSLLVLLAAASAVILAACGGGGGGSAASAPVDQAGVQRAADLVQGASVRPSDLNVTEPIGKPVPPGKVVDFVSCPAADCNVIAGMLKVHTDKLGWTLNVLTTDGSPGSQQQAFAQIVRDRADGAIYIGIDRGVYERYLPELQANGTWMVSVCSTNPQGNGIDFAICTPDQQRETGRLMAASVISHSGGRANAVYVNVPAFDNLSKLQDEFLASMKELCPACPTASQDVPITALGNGVPQLVVGYLRAHPDVDYVVLAIDSLASGLPAALKAAGLDHVEIVGQGGGDTTWQYIKTGEQLASVPWPYVETYLAGLDSIVRHVTGVQAAPSQLPRFWIVTKNNVAETDLKVDGITPVVIGADAKFAQLWGASS